MKIEDCAVIKGKQERSLINVKKRPNCFHLGQKSFQDDQCPDRPIEMIMTQKFLIIIT